ncbi:MAG: discoidin domain-containing protein [Bacteroidales bacterium]|nr:discoidin domain-containing protein [Bacteroidales bacterium]
MKNRQTYRVLFILSGLLILNVYQSYALMPGERKSSAKENPLYPQTFCNPINLDYGPYYKGSRHAADPVIVLFKDKYYLFTSWDKKGYRVSDDLLHWNVILFDSTTFALASNDKKEIIAPAVATDGRYIYYVGFGLKNILRTSDPASGKWEVSATHSGGYGDPAIFFDSNGMPYILWGMNESNIMPLHPKDLSEIKDATRKMLVPRLRTEEDFAAANPSYGLYQGQREFGRVNWNLPGSLDTESLIGKFLSAPSQEGPWLTKHGGRYYLENASSGTANPWYSDCVWESDSIMGPYRLADYAPSSMKVGGFISSAGHSCVFQDKYGNWWKATTMWVGVYAGFERRIGLFPVGFDKKGRMFTQTELGDYPMVMPSGLRDPNKNSALVGWSVLSTGKACTASSTLENRKPELASDENVRTWWSAKTGNKGEWFRMDLGKPCTINAVQVNFAEQDCLNEPLNHDYTAYQLLVSNDGENWTVVVDKSTNKTAVPHDYVALDKPVTARYLKVVNIYAAKDGKFALRDLRVFGNGGGKTPAMVNDLVVKRLEDKRNVTFTWKPSSSANGYVIHYGVAPDALYLSIQVQGGNMSKLTVSCLNRDVKYYYRIDAYNENGIAKGKVTRLAQ